MIGSTSQRTRAAANRARRPARAPAASEFPALREPVRPSAALEPTRVPRAALRARAAAACCGCRWLSPWYRLAIHRLGCFQARGKSIVAEKLERFLAWRGWRTQAFSAGAPARGAGGSSFFDKKSGQARASRWPSCGPTSPPPPHRAYTSPTSPAHLAHISRTSRLHLPHISPTSPLYLPGGKAGAGGGARLLRQRR